MLSWILRAFGWLGAWALLLVVGFLTYSKFAEYSPEQIEKITVIGEPQTFDHDTIKIVTWNIGYAGLGSDMDFFMDGGQSVQCSRGRTIENLRGIVRFLVDSCADADFILLQEVDRDSKRSYNINEYDTIVRYLGQQYKAYFASNFAVGYVPIPIKSPIGSVDAGLMSLSRVTPREVVRVSYPNGTSWPQSMFDLKRCMLSLELSFGDSLVLYVNNTHNSAYDDGGQRTSEIVFLNSYISGKRYSITVGDWNSNPPTYRQSAAELKDEYFRPIPLKIGDFPPGYHFATDTSTYSARYGYEPYDSLSTTRTIIDFAVTSPDIRPVEVRCVDLGFVNSDHNPVIIKFIVKR